MTRYFAYGSNMEVAQMKGRCSNPTQRGAAQLTGWRFLVMSRGFATIVPDPASTVWGILWDLTDEDVARLDRYEGVAQGSYHKETVSVIDTTGVVTEALVYIARETDPGVPKADYIGRTLKGARAGGFPDVYVTELESWRA